jgi:hypothetical protein
VCRTPRQVFALTFVNRAFREAIVDFKLAASIFDRIFDARNEWQIEEDVKTIWLQAGAIMLKHETPQQQESAQEQNLPPFEPVLVSEMTAAMKRENVKAGAELDEFVAAQEKPARHRLLQTRGTLAAAFRGCGHNLCWFGEASFDDILLDATADPRQKRSPSTTGPMYFSLKLEQRFVVGLAFTNMPPLKRLDLSLFPSTISESGSLIVLRMGGTDCSAFDTSAFFTSLADACPRLSSMDVSGALLACPFSFAALARFKNLTYADLSQNDMWCSSLNFDELPAASKLQRLYLMGGEKLRGPVTGTRPAALTGFFFSDTELQYTEYDVNLMVFLLLVA